jgi:broad specificity phosphatase PhoE
MRLTPLAQARLFAALLLLCAAPAIVAQPSTVIIVRHAEKASTPGPDPVLSEAGIERARALAAAIADVEVGSVITTQFKRTRETAAPVLAARGLEPVTVPASRDMPAHIKAVADVVRRRPAGTAVLVVGHSNTVPAIITALGGPRMTELCESDYDNLFILQFPVDSSPRLIRARFGAPDDADGTSC